MIALALMTCTAITPLYAQFPFYFSSGNFNPPNSWNQSNAVRMGTVANTNIQIAQPTAVGNCYFRFFSGQSGGTTYEPNGNNDVFIPYTAPFSLQVTGGFGKAYYVTTTTLTDNYIFKTDGNGAPGNTRATVIVVHGSIQSIVSLSRFPAGNVYDGQTVTVTANTSAALSSGQGVYLRYSPDHWQTSTVVEMQGSGTTYSAVIPGYINATGSTLNYYVFTSGSAIPIGHFDADLMTINLYNNNFKNFSYPVQCNEVLNNTTFQTIQTDKARYNPGDSVHFTTVFKDSIPSGSLYVKYWHLDDTLAAEIFTLSKTRQFSWTLLPLSTDFRGYFAEVKLVANNIVTDSVSIGVDVSSDWKKFPRYGFLSQYSYTDSTNRNILFSNLNRFHLNGLQFYDVNYKHHMPLAGTVNNPDTIWNDIANRAVYLSTVSAYIGLAHKCNMMVMNYNLLYGAYSNSAVSDGVSNSWGLYYDANHQNHVQYTLPASWASNLQVENPADTNWQSYLFAQEKKLFQALPYDGWHVDQLGDQGTVYNYNGQTVNLAASFGSYLQKAKATINVPLVMNAVTNYGQSTIATAPVEFLYTEVWPPYNTYSDLISVIDANNSYSNNTLSTVLAAYMNRSISDSAGLFNTAAVLLTDAVIFAAGGSHIEMGDHLLGNEYFPNSNLIMACALQEKLTRYYDFMVGYENLLRDNIATSNVALQTTGANALSTTAATGKIWVLSKMKSNTQIFHLINLTTATTLNWNDPNDNQPTPGTILNIPLSFTTDSVVTKIFVASPDWNNGMPVSVPFIQIGSNVSFTLPSLNYWTMVTVQSKPQITTDVAGENISEDVTVYPNPFTEEVNFRLNFEQPSLVSIKIMNELGQVISQSLPTSMAGIHTMSLLLPVESQGIYYWMMDVSAGSNGHRVMRGKLLHL